MNTRIRSILAVLTPLALVAGSGGCKPGASGPPAGIVQPQAPPHDNRRLPPQESAQSASFSGDGALLLLALRAEGDFRPPVQPRGLVLWDVASGKRLWTRTQAQLGGQPWRCAFFPDGKKIAAAVEGRLMVLDAGDGTEVRTLLKDLGQQSALAVSPDGKAILVGDGHGSIQLIDAANGSVLKKLDAGADEAVAFSPDGGLALSVSQNPGLCYLWDLTKGEPIRRFPAADGWGGRPVAAFSPDGKRAVLQKLDFRDQQHALVVIETKEGQPLQSLTGDICEVAVFAAGGKRLLCASTDRSRLALRDADSGKEEWAVALPGARVVAVSPDGRRAFAAAGSFEPESSHRMSLQVYDGATGKLLRQLDSGGTLISVLSE